MPRIPLLLTLLATALSMLARPEPAPACLRPALDERAVQWSTAIVTAKLLTVGERTPLGEATTPQGEPGQVGRRPGGRTLPDLIHHYSQRLYTFEVSERLDGALKKGDRVRVVRIFDQVENPMIICSRHLKGAAPGRSFLLLLRPLSDFKELRDRIPEAFAKERAGEPEYVVVHLEPADGAGGGAVADARELIESVRRDESAATDRGAAERIGRVVAAEDDVKAEPAVRDLARMGPKVVPAVEAAAKKAAGDAKARLNRLAEELKPPDPVTSQPTGPVSRQGGDDE